MRLLPALLLATCLALPARAGEVVVFAAASLKAALDRVAADFTAATGNKVTVSYAGSGTLAQQIIQGAPADIFMSAAPEWMDAVAAEGLVVPGSRVDLLGNALVLVAPAPADPLAMADLPARLGTGKLAMGMLASVPAGQYGKAALQSQSLWEALAPQVAQADNVRAALALVASGEAPFGIVFRSDAQAEPAVTVVSEFPEDSHPPIRYPAALLAGSTDTADRLFLAALQSDAARTIFAEAGFTPLTQP